MMVNDTDEAKDHGDAIIDHRCRQAQSAAAPDAGTVEGA
jgi:hypothetical protein